MTQYERDLIKWYIKYRKAVKARQKEFGEEWDVAVGETVGYGNIKLFRQAQQLYLDDRKGIDVPTPKPVIKVEQLELNFDGDLLQKWIDDHS